MRETKLKDLGRKEKVIYVQSCISISYYERGICIKPVKQKPIYLLSEEMKILFAYYKIYLTADKV